MKFTDLPLIAPIQFALKEVGYETPTPIQAKSIPLLLEGKDLLGIAQTGTGKTAAFSLPIIQRMDGHRTRPKPLSPRTLVLSPTRELTLQIHESFEAYGKHTRVKSAVIFGGVGQGPQVSALKAGPDVLVATPGRLMDLYEQGFIKFDQIEVFVLDEADQMLERGFLADVKRIVMLLPKKRQNLFFSATMPKEIQDLAGTILHHPEKVEITPPAKTAEKIEQFVYFVNKDNKLNLLIELLKDNNLFKVLVFVEMKHVANRLTDKLQKVGISAVTIHSDKSQGARQRALEEFKNDKARVLVATDIAARGIDIDAISHVINYDLSHIVENYVHRIGRTARAGATGIALTFCTAEERSFLFAIERETRQKITPIVDSPFHSEEAMKSPVMGVGKAKAALEAKRRENRDRHRPPRRAGASSAKSGGKSSGGGGSGRGPGGKPKFAGKSKRK